MADIILKDYDGNEQVYTGVNTIRVQKEGGGHEDFSSGGGGGAILQSKTVYLDENEPVTVTPDEGYDGLSSVSFDTSGINNYDIRIGSTVCGVGGWFDPGIGNAVLASISLPSVNGVMSSVGAESVSVFARVDQDDTVITFLTVNASAIGMSNGFAVCVGYDDASDTVYFRTLLSDSRYGQFNIDASAQLNTENQTLTMISASSDGIDMMPYISAGMIILQLFGCGGPSIYS